MIIFQLFIIFLLFVCFSFFIGKLILAFYSSSEESTIKTYNLSFSFLTGLLLINIVTSILYCGIFTSQILLLIPIFLSIYFSRKLISFNLILRFSNLGLPFLFAIGIFFLQWFFFNSNLNPNNLFFDDIRLYTETISGMLRGYENSFGGLSNYNNPTFHNIVPYHYSELWLTIVLQSIFNIDGGVPIILQYIVYPSLMLGLILLIWDFGKAINVKRSKIILFLLIALLIGPLPSVFTSNWFSNLPFVNSVIIFENYTFFDFCQILSTNSQKQLPGLLALMVGLIYFFEKNRILAFVWIGSSIYLNVGVLPGILGGTVLWSIYEFISKKQLREILSINSLLFVQVVSYLAFYLFFSKESSNQSDDFLYLGSSSLNLKGEFLRFFFRIIFGLLYLILINAPIILLLSFSNNFRRIIEEDKSLIILTICFILAPVLARPILQGFNSGQFITYVTCPFYILIILISLKVKIQSKLFYISITLLCVLNLSFQLKESHGQQIPINEKYSQNYVYQVVSSIKNQKATIGYINNESTQKKIPYPFWYNHNFPNTFLYNYGHYDFISLNFPFQIYNESSINEFSTRNSMQYFMNSCNEKKYLSKISKITDSLEIKYISGASDKIPLWVKLKSNKIIKDSKSGHWFAILLLK